MLLLGSEFGMLETVFLIVLILALLLGNIFLHFTKPGKNAPKQDYPYIEEIKSSSIEPEGSFDCVYDLQGNVKALDQKVRMAHSRLTELEKKISFKKSSARKGDTAYTGKALKDLAEKINRFERFRENTVIEIAALKDMLSESNAVQAKKAKKPKKNELAKAKKNVDELDKRIQSIVFRGGRY